ncbi:hypothetical protein K353_00240 [Kitasatospora sp. SolWspMP-SS2h]|uniref:hypothetical protein n=1 Tax=Kitasatospora sp. SolWspMP-SS2h TaxID=1305729 RepID=UPI000DBFF5C8|nr:hypothetical protein [Kitasatospora sp. SolWspMP-SS2h]RAJ47039.1 hypothetical protein K353_00240 [Kitasatospora sp. SolWspMP-SS2h]
MSRAATAAIGRSTRKIERRPNCRVSSPPSTGPGNLRAVVITRSAREPYAHLTTGVAALPGVQHLETAPTIRIVEGPGPLPPASPRDI